ncbi:MAG: hypothetical protein AVDCRST_MAG27-2197, partial [uncultured Craurococcus sp.]
GGYHGLEEAAGDRDFARPRNQQLRLRRNRL